MKHRIHLCHLRLHEFKEAKAILERIPQVERSIKILSSLADLYFQEKNIDKAKENYLEILKQDPLRLDFVIKLCKLGYGSEANSILQLIPDEIKKVYTWYPTWIHAQCHLHSPNSKQAIRLFETLTSRFEKRASILTRLAEAHYHDGNFREAIRIYQIAYNSDSLTLSGVGSYAACLHKESSKKTLEDLAVQMSSKCNIEGEYFHEPWLVLAHYYASNDKKEPKALLFAQKAYKLNRYSVEALSLLACLCLEKKDSGKAIPYIMTAQTMAPYLYEVQRILCDSFLANNKKPSALSYAKAAIKSLGENARSYYLWADIILKSQDQRRKNSARNCLEKAVRIDPTYLPAVFALTDLLIEEKRFEKALAVLQTASPHHSVNNDLHKYLYTCYIEMGDSDKALYHQNMASDHDTKNYRNKNELLHRGATSGAAGTSSGGTGSGSQLDPIATSEEDIGQILGLEADELVDHGDSEVDESNLDS